MIYKNVSLYSGYTLNIAPKFLPINTDALIMFIAKNVIAQTPNAHAKNGPSPSKLTNS